MRSLVRSRSFDLRFAGFLCIFLCIVACSPGNGSAQIHWTRHPANPVLRSSPPGAWDNGHIFFPSVAYVDSTYVMWYGVNDTSRFRTGRAISSDAITWQRDPATPVLDAGSQGAWDQFGAWSPHVLVNGNSYVMWYQGAGGVEQFGTWQVGRATSADGKLWQKESTNPVMTVGPPGSWESDDVGASHVLFDGSTYRMWYDGWSGHWPGTSDAIGLASSPDGLTWTKHPSNPVLTTGGPGTWEGTGIGYGPMVIYDAGHYHMWYTGNTLFDLFGTSGIGYAVSADGIHWKKYPRNPVLRPGTGWEQTVYGAAVMLRGSMFEMWYGGVGPPGWLGQIGYANAPRSPASIVLSDTSRDFGNVSPGQVSDTLHLVISNWGFTHLALSGVVHSRPEFSVIDLPSLPPALPPFEEAALNILFRPTVPGALALDTIRISTNDSLQPVVKVVLRGRGSAPVAAAQQDIAYAINVAGAQVQLSTIDLTNAHSTPVSLIFPHLFPEVQGIALRGSDGIIYASSSTPGETKLYRVSAEGGDVEIAARIPQGGIRGIYFTPGDTLILSDSTGRLFGMKSLSSPPFLIDSSGVPIYGFAKSLTTGVLWGVSQFGIYKISLPSWDMTLVGAFPGVLRPSIAFGKFGTLYGLFDGDLFEIDRVTGAPALVGTTNTPEFRGMVIRTGVIGTDVGGSPGLPQAFALNQNYPNPFNPATTIQFDLPSMSHVELSVYDVLGRLVANLADEVLPAGKYARVLNGISLASGVYFARLRAGSFSSTRSLILLR